MWVSFLFMVMIAYATEAWMNPGRGHRRSRKTARDAIKVVVIGGGWAGFSAADALSTATTSSSSSFSSSSSDATTTTSTRTTKQKSDHDDDTTTVHIELLDASPRGPGGLAGAGWLTPKLGMPVEAGIHGFWREYRNTFATMERIGLQLDDVFTDYIPSVLISQTGRVALAPVLGKKQVAQDTGATTTTTTSIDPMQLLSSAWSGDTTKLLEDIATLLPPPLDLALSAKFAPDSPLSALDRISALGLLGAWADFKPDDHDSWQRYDNMSAESLFCASAGITRTLYRELVSPLLHVLPMTPGYDCSAAAALSCFHVFALQSRGAFDVRWCRGSIQERIFQPWVQRLQERGNVNIRGSAKVTAIQENVAGSSSSQGNPTPRFTVTVNENETIQCDAIVFAIGATTMKRFWPNFAPLTGLPITKTWDRLRGVTCVAVRLFFRVPTSGGTFLPAAIEQAMSDSPVFVCGSQIGGLSQLAETGFCIYDLQRLQDEFPYQMDDERVAALEVDFFRADPIANMADDSSVASFTLKAIAAALNIDPVDPSLVLDVSVVRAQEAVSHFDVSSASCSPQVKLERGLYMCGDWVDRTGHASWSTEKAVVTGRQAAAAFAQDFRLQCQANVIPAAKDSPQLAALRQLMGAIRSTTPLRNFDGSLINRF